MILSDIFVQCPRTHTSRERLLFADQFFTGMVEQCFHDDRLLKDFLYGRDVFIDSFDFGLRGTAEDKIVETIMAGWPEGVRLDENTIRTELLDRRQLKTDFKMAPLLDLWISAEHRFAIDLQVVAFF